MSARSESGMFSNNSAKPLACATVGNSVTIHRHISPSPAAHPSSGRRRSRSVLRNTVCSIRPLSMGHLLAVCPAIRRVECQEDLFEVRLLAANVQYGELRRRLDDRVERADNRAAQPEIVHADILHAGEVVKGL